jgi:hypothetical protein
MNKINPPSMKGKATERSRGKSRKSSLNEDLDGI